MKSCREITRLLSEAQDRDLTLGERAELKFHTMMCSACRNFGKQLTILRSIARSYSGGSADRLKGDKPGDRRRDN